MNFRPFLNITFLLFAMLLLNSCAAVTAPVAAVSGVLNNTVNTVGSVAGKTVGTAGAVVGAPFALMQ